MDRRPDIGDVETEALAVVVGGTVGDARMVGISWVINDGDDGESIRGDGFDAAGSAHVIAALVVGEVEGDAMMDLAAAVDGSLHARAVPGGPAAAHAGTMGGDFCGAVGNGGGGFHGGDEREHGGES